MAEAFGRSIQKAQAKGTIKGVMVAENVANINDQQFFDDPILPEISTKEETKAFKQIRSDYTTTSG